MPKARATAAMAAAAGNQQQQQQMVSGLGLPVPGMPNGLQVPNSMGLAAGATSQQILAAASGLLQAQQGGLQQMQPMRVSPPPQPMPQLTPYGIKIALGRDEKDIAALLASN